jgi:hypothetical protein
MRWSTTTAFAAILLAGATGVSIAQTANQPAAGPGFEDLVGKKLTAIDGSSIALTAAEGGMAREIVAANGTIQRSYFAFINEKLGTVADANDIRKVTGVFRRSDTAMEIQYSDGSREKLRLNSGGGLTLETVSAASTACVSWYPDGHMFSVEERKAALAAFAVRLGLADSNANTNANPDCRTNIVPSEVKLTPAKAATEMMPVMEQAKAVDQAVPKPGAAKMTFGAPATPPIPAPSPHTLLTAVDKPPAAPAPTAAAVAAEAHEIEVRKSDVHVIDPVPADDGKPQVLASADAANPAAPTQKGASACLSVESDGSHWGFRNHCGYTVQFAYCLMAGTQLASCRDGAVAGSVAGNGFGALIADESLKETDAMHEFRWVACQGGAGEVIPHLDRIDPPAGRCVR